MRVLCAPDSFKGSLDANHVAQAIRRGISQSAPSWIVDTHPLADGGEGTLDILSEHGFQLETRRVRNHQGREIEADFGLRGKTALIESARACGFDPAATVDDALTASSFGVGQLISQALDAGASEILLTIGGTATTDGGAGMVTALGARLLDIDGNPIQPGGKGLLELRTVDRTALDARITATKFRVLSDVTNPLLGPSGAAQVFAPQKGADAGAVAMLDAGLTKLQGVLNSDRAQDVGAGAGGGLGFAALEFLGAEVLSGAREVMRLTGFAEKLDRADLVITGEGSFDAQSLSGKVPHEVMVAARKKGIPVLLVCGRAAETTSAELEALGLVHLICLTDLEPDIDRCISVAEELLFRVGNRIPSALNF